MLSFLHTSLFPSLPSPISLSSLFSFIFYIMIISIHTHKHTQLNVICNPTFPRHGGWTFIWRWGYCWFPWLSLYAVVLAFSFSSLSLGGQNLYFVSHPESSLQIRWNVNLLRLSINQCNAMKQRSPILRLQTSSGPWSTSNWAAQTSESHLCMCGMQAACEIMYPAVRRTGPWRSKGWRLLQYNTNTNLLKKGNI